MSITDVNNSALANQVNFSDKSKSQHQNQRISEWIGVSSDGSLVYMPIDPRTEKGKKFIEDFEKMQKLERTPAADVVNFTSKTQESKEFQADTADFKSKNLSDTEKKELILKARTKAAGWSIVGGPISTLYYGLRSDNTVAEKYNLDPNEDKDLVKRIKHEQTIATIPSLIWGPGGLCAYIYNKTRDANDIDL